MDDIDKNNSEAITGSEKDNLLQDNKHAKQNIKGMVLGDDIFYLSNYEIDMGVKSNHIMSEPGFHPVNLP